MIVDIPTIENFFSNSCFVILFFTTFYYWLKISFLADSQYSETGLVGYGTSLFCLTSLLISRWIDSGHFPLSNLYESLIFLAWCLLLLYIFIEKAIKTIFLGVLTSPAILCLVAFTDFSLPQKLQQSSPLVPALQSNWLVMHVTVMIASYAALLLGCLVAIAYLIFSNFFTKQDQSGFGEKKGFELKSNRLEQETNLINNTTLNFSFEKTTTQNSFDSKNEIFRNQIQPNLILDQHLKSNTTKILFFLDNLSYRTIGIGFCFLTLGILSGAVWANETWGNYWSWDPKETWALITWLTFACYLHSRLIGGWAGPKPAWIASFGFFVVWVCYLGVNLLGQGLHSYGFLQL